MNLKKTLSNIGSWVFIGVTFLGFIIIYAGFGGRGDYEPMGATNWYFVGIGTILVLPFIIYMIKISISLKKSSDENEERINQLIKTGDIVPVSLNDVEILSNSYQQEIEVGSGYRKRNEYIDVNHNFIRLDIPYKNQTIKYELNIDMELQKLKMHFAIKEKTELYVDPLNPNNNYLDLTFLEH